MVRMKRSIFLILLTFIFTSVSTGSAIETAEDYANLISAVYETSSSSSVILEHFIGKDDLWSKNLVFNIQWILSGRKIMSSAINMNQLYDFDRKRWWKMLNSRRTTKTMHVFIIMSAGDYSKMAAKSDAQTQNNVINFVLFIKQGREENNFSLQTCVDPRGNPFGRRTGYSFLVKCYENTTIREWHSHNRRRLEIHERATWEQGTGLVLKSDKLVLGVEEKLRGKVLRTFSYMNLRSLDMVHFLETSGKFTIRNSILNREPSWTNYDFAENPFFMSPDMMSGFASEYTKAIRKTKNVFVIREPERKVVIWWTAYFQPFKLRLWIAFVIIFIVIQCIRVFMKTRLETELGDDRLVVDDFLYVFGIFCQQGLPGFPRALSLTIFYCTIFFFAFCTMSIYSAGFVSELTKIETSLPFESMEDFARVKTHELIVLSNSYLYDEFKEATKSPWKEVGLLMKNKSDLTRFIDRAIKMVCQNRIALFDYEDDMLIPEYGHICPLLVIDTKDVRPLAMLFPRYSPLTRPINLLITKIMSSGLWKVRRGDFERKETVFYSVKEPEVVYPSATLWDISVAFTFLFGSIVLTVTILLLEVIHFKLKKVNKVESLELLQPQTALLKECVERPWTHPAGNRRLAQNRAISMPALCQYQSNPRSLAGDG